jgi:exodeoxyribonuclease V beta subunit
MTATQTPATFVLTGPLPTGTTAIEASAGTGKTHTIVSLATRFVAEQDIPLSQLLLVTFGRPATAELRDRARTRFRDCAAALADPAAARKSKDETIKQLASANAAEVKKRHQRLVRAMSDFDAATIVTTHSFCQRMLDGVGIAGDYQPDATFCDSVADLIGEVSDDLYVARFSMAQAPPMTVREARTIVTEAADDPHAVLVPNDAPAESPAAERFSFATSAREELTRRKRRRAVRDFNDLLVLLRNALKHPVYGPVARKRIRSRYRVVLVDEFQDTDPIQWEILRLAFHNKVTMILVGDPKQAIYAFRGADVITYLDAVSTAGPRTALTKNWRTDEGLVHALDRLYGNAELGYPEIVARPVRAAHQQSRIPGEKPLRLRYLDRAVLGGSGSDLPPVDEIRRYIARDVAHDIATLLSPPPQKIFDDKQPRNLKASDIAVLVRTRYQGSLVCEELDAAKVPYVVTGGFSVFTTIAATAWQRMLAALEQPQRPERVRLAALRPLLSFTADELAVDGDALMASLSAQLRGWAAVFERSGPASMFELIAASRGLAARLVGVEGGERLLTDLRHLSQLMNRVVNDEQLGLASLSSWLARRITDEQITATSDRSRLLDRQTDAVRVVTIHRSKGLEFPIVYLPFCWDAGKHSQRNKPDVLSLHDERGQRVCDVGGKKKRGDDYDQRLARYWREGAGEELRLLYVAATRAQNRVVAWWAPTCNTWRSPLHRLIFGRPDGAAEPEAAPALPEDHELAEGFSKWAAPVDDLVSIEPVLQEDSFVEDTLHQVRATGKLAVAQFERVFDWSWRRLSYSRLTAAVHIALDQSLSETEEPATVDEPDAPLVAAPVPGGDTPSLMNDLPAGKAFGTLVHAVLERVDTSAPDLAAEVQARTEQVAESRLVTLDVDALATALTAVMTTPTPGGTLASVAPADRLTELAFELPLAGGDHASDTAATLAAIADVLATHLAPSDPLAGYPDLLRNIPDATLRGYMTGSIDAVLRFPGPRYVIVDYKTNKLFAGPVDAAQFDQAAMAREMLREHYPLQALLYSVALHRYLRWRQPAYDPGKHLGGVLYLFVRAMIGERTPQGCGVFFWHPPAELVVALSDLLAGR